MTDKVPVTSPTAGARPPISIGHNRKYGVGYGDIMRAVNVMPGQAGSVALSELAGLITRQVPLAQWADAYTRQLDDSKTILTF